MKKIFLIVFLLIFALVTEYFAASFHFLNEEVKYYGVITSGNNKVKKLVSEDNSIENYELINDTKFKNGDFVCVITTESNGTIIEEKKVKKNEIPRVLKKRYPEVFN